ncbi:Sec-independent protein translocase subunit TatA [Jatrophihabitans endophyticus]|uniref:Sec-independent protein translocase subunit TatA n=1 Tax=Jatrophihabitans endophyticus TaxID=1206085 RepID=UPI001A02D71E|nr:Sec-independent protein translocase subunit TatA [Jatrophihabitans endophyticus]MBE7186687.1 Sec-independent protein translocase subunit TatA [Jatrophihabitans endophyticus]
MDGIFSPWHIVIVLAVAAILFYRGDKLPDMARSVGRSLRVFKTEIKGLAEDDKARDAAQHTSDESEHGLGVSTTKDVEPKAIEASPAAAQTDPAAPRVVARAATPIPVQAEVVRTPERASRPRPRPAGSAPRQ